MSPKPPTDPAAASAMDPAADPTPLTDRQQAVLDFIRRHGEEEGLPPTLQQIADGCGLAQACGALKHVRRLAQAGYLQVLPNQARGIRLLRVAPGARDTAGNLVGSETRAQRRRRDRSNDDHRLDLPILGRVAAGAPIGADAGVERHVLLDRGLFSTQPDYLLHVRGDSMRDDGIFDGDLVAVHRTGEARNGQVVVARIDGEITIKRFEQTATHIRLLPRNPDYAPIVVQPGSDFAIEGLYCGLVRSD